MGVRNGREHKVGANVGDVGDGVEIKGHKCWGWLGGAYILALLVHVALCCSHGFGEVLADYVGGQAGPCGKMSVVNGPYPGGGDGIPTGRMEELDMFYHVGSVVCTVGVV
jgi:hypothetical protein